MRERFPHKKKGDILGAGHINDLSRVAREISGGGPGSNISSRGGVYAAPPQFIQRVCIVVADYTEVSDESSSSSSASSGSLTEHPECDTSYQVIPRYYDASDRTWKTSDEEGPYCLDASEFGDGLEIGDIVVAWWDIQRGAFVGGNIVPTPADPPPTPDPTPSSGCTCDGGICIDDVDGNGDPIIPSAYYFTLGAKSANGFNCGCTVGDESGDGVITLEQVTPGGAIYRSASVTCPDIPTTTPCSATGHWRWVAEVEVVCVGEVQFIWGPIPGEPPTIGWSIDQYNTPCLCQGAEPIETAPEDSICGPPDTASFPDGGFIGDLLVRDCDHVAAGESCGSVIPGYWVLDSTDGDCACTPPYPDFDGTTSGDLTTTICSGTSATPATTPSGDYESYWQFNRSTCALAFIVGSTTKVSYGTRAPMGCCPYCANRLERTMCGPFDCTHTPCEVCLYPGYPTVDGSMFCDDSEVEIPQQLNVTITPDSDCTLPCVNEFVNATLSLVSNDGITAMYLSDWYATTMSAYALGAGAIDCGCNEAVYHPGTLPCDTPPFRPVSVRVRVIISRPASGAPDYACKRIHVCFDYFQEAGGYFNCYTDEALVGGLAAEYHSGAAEMVNIALGPVSVGALLTGVLLGQGFTYCTNSGTPRHVLLTLSTVPAT